MVFLRRAGRIVPILTLVGAIASASLIAQSKALETPERPDTSKGPEAGQPSTGNQQSAQPPIQVTITQPDPSAQQLDAERQNRDRETAVQEQIGTFTGWLVVVGAIQSVLIAVGLFASIRAAKAATASANIADSSLRILNRPWLDTDDWSVTEQRSDINDLAALVIRFNVVNPSRTPATIYEIEVTDIGSGSPPDEWTVSSDVGNLLTPGGKHPHDATILVEAMVERQIADYETGRGFTVEISGVVHFSDLFCADPRHPKRRQRRFGRRCVLRRTGGSEFHPVAGAESVDREDSDKR